MICNMSSQWQKLSIVIVLATLSFGIWSLEFEEGSFHTFSLFGKAYAQSEIASNTALAANKAVYAVDHRLFLPIVIKPPAWERLGNGWPSGRSTQAVAACSVNDGSTFIFAGTPDALYSLNGSSWTIVEPVAQGFVVTGIVFGENCNHVYASLYSNGIWRGNRDGNTWNWQKREGGASVAQVRALVLAQGNLFAAGEFGISYWQGTEWLPTSAPGSVSQPIMDMHAANSSGSQTKIYAVQWLNGRILTNPDPGSAPGVWGTIPNIADVPNIQMRAVFGDTDNVRYTGTTAAHYRLAGNQWSLAQVVGARSFATDSNSHVYAGYTDNAGVYFSTDGGTFLPLNAGWVPPENVFSLITHNQTLYAATSNGVWVYPLP
jgi:hypothetical protein